MKNIGLLFFAFWLSIFPVKAEDVSQNKDMKEATADVTEEELNAFGYPDKSLVAVIDNTPTNTSDLLANMPSCDDPQLVEQALEVLKPYLQDDSGTIIEKRRIALLRKSLHNFEELDSDIITPKEDLSAADRLLELKINNKLDSHSVRLCRSSLPATKNSVYLVMYFTESKLMVEILNFTNGDELKFNFKSRP